MKLAEVLAEEKKSYKVRFVQGRHTRVQDYTEAGLKRVKFFTHGDLKRIEKLAEHPAYLKLTHEDESGKTTIFVSRNK